MKRQKKQKKLVKKPSKKPVLAWRFVHADLKLPNGDGRDIVVGKMLVMPKGDIIPCHRGLHASRRAIDALQFADQNRVRIARVVCSGTVENHATRGGKKYDKLACSKMKHLWIASEADTQKMLRLFAVWCAREALKLVKTPDPRSVAACDVSERYAHGKATAAELSAAWDAAWGAARSAAWGAAWDAAWGAARDAAWGVAKDAARARQNKKLTQMFLSLKP